MKLARTVLFSLPQCRRCSLWSSVLFAPWPGDSDNGKPVWTVRIALNSTDTLRKPGNFIRARVTKLTLILCPQALVVGVHALEVTYLFGRQSYPHSNHAGSWRCYLETSCSVRTGLILALSTPIKVYIVLEFRFTGPS